MSDVLARAAHAGAATRIREVREYMKAIDVFAKGSVVSGQNFGLAA